ncbi:hypothetical protein B9Z65_4017 [Elsinoe australis]|uniref:Uncharacterized protein n=1 Tax=Elsinoe australis TaxID=40998 RepID=A0A2P7Z1M3_9PEZI|nr:hypothetical protein B9Z65_4017 [Elsinoe australis]
MLGSSIVNPMIKPRVDQLMFLELADQMNGRQILCKQPSGQQTTDPEFVPGLGELERKIALSVAYHRKQTYGHLANVDDFAFCDELPVSLNLDLLKINCVTYFSSQAAYEQWVPFTSIAPHTFLSSLSLSAPYTDLMDHPAREALSPYTDTRHTLELMDIVPRIINDRLRNAADAHEDCDIVAVTTLLVGQMSTPYGDFIPAHKHALKLMITARGGLGSLGGKGVIAMNLTLANLESSILRHESAEQMYIDWIDNYLTTHTTQKLPSPESPLYCSAAGMLQISVSPYCKRETLKLVVLMHDLTQLVLQLGQLERKMQGAVRAAVFDDRIRIIIESTHLMPQISAESTAEEDWIYESVRLTAVLFCHAVSQRRPLHRNLACTSPIKCRVTPTMIQSALKRTPIKPLWGHLAGVLYWVLMIASAACHEHCPNIEDHPSDSSSSSAGSSYTPESDPIGPLQHYGAVLRAIETYDKIVLCESPDASATNTPTSRSRSDSGAHVDDPPPAHVRANNKINTAKELYRKYVPDRQVSAGPRPSVRRSREDEDSTGSESGLSSKARRLSTSVHTAGDRQAAREAYVKRYLTANAMRVSILLRFEHKVVFLGSVRHLLRVTEWLEGK